MDIGGWGGRQVDRRQGSERKRRWAGIQGSDSQMDAQCSEAESETFGIFSGLLKAITLKNSLDAR